MKNKLIIAVFILFGCSCTQNNRSFVNREHMELINEYLGYYAVTYGNVKVWYKKDQKKPDHYDIEQQNKTHYKVSEDMDAFYNKNNLIKYKRKTVVIFN